MSRGGGRIQAGESRRAGRGGAPAAQTASREAPSTITRQSEMRTRSGLGTGVREQWKIAPWSAFSPSILSLRILYLAEAQGSLPQRPGVHHDVMLGNPTAQHQACPPAALRAQRRRQLVPHVRACRAAAASGNERILCDRHCAGRDDRLLLAGWRDRGNEVLHRAETARQRRQGTAVQKGTLAWQRPWSAVLTAAGARWADAVHRCRNEASGRHRCDACACGACKRCSTAGEASTLLTSNREDSRRPAIWTSVTSSAQLTWPPPAGPAPPSCRGDAGALLASAAAPSSAPSDGLTPTEVPNAARPEPPDPPERCSRPEPSAVRSALGMAKLPAPPDRSGAAALCTVTLPACTSMFSVRLRVGSGRLQGAGGSRGAGLAAGRAALAGQGAPAWPGGSGGEESTAAGGKHRQTGRPSRKCSWRAHLLLRACAGRRRNEGTGWLRR